MTNVGKGMAIPPGSVHDRGLYLGCMILIAPSGGWGVWAGGGGNTSSGSHRNLIPILPVTPRRQAADV